MIKRRILLSQLCSHCYEVTNFIHDSGMYSSLLDHEIRIDMVNTENKFAVNLMGRAIAWLTVNDDADLYEDQESVTPILVEEDLTGITKVIVNSNNIIDYLKALA